MNETQKIANDTWLRCRVTPPKHFTCLLDDTKTEEIKELGTFDNVEISQQCFSRRPNDKLEYWVEAESHPERMKEVVKLEGLIKARSVYVIETITAGSLVYRVLKCRKGE